MATQQELENLFAKQKRINTLEEHIQDIHKALLTSSEYDARNRDPKSLDDLLKPELKRVELKLKRQYDRNYSDYLWPELMGIDSITFLRIYLQNANDKLAKLKSEFESIKIEIPEKQ